MCGLFGVLLAPGERSPEAWQSIADLFTAGLVDNQARGRDATGVALIRDDGTFRLYKASLPAARFTTDPYYKSLLRRVEERTTAMIGHARLPTKGDPACYCNNHPILVGNVVGVHNGHVENDDALFAHYSLPRTGEVDSEIIFRMLNELAPSRDPARYVADVAKIIGEMNGIITMLSVDLRRPHWLLIVKNGAPLSFHYDAALRALFFSSRYLFLRKTFGHDVVFEKLPRASVMLYDARELPEIVARTALQEKVYAKRRE